MSAPGRFRARIDRDRAKKFKAFRIKRGMSPDAPFWHEKPLALEAYEEALDGVTYAGMGGYPAIQEAFYAAAEACLDVMEPGWRDRA